MLRRRLECARRAGERGQAVIIVAVFLTVLLGMAGAVIDVGYWFRADRALQATVDAAALAGAQALPEDPSEASQLAVAYGNKNGGGVGATNVAYTSELIANDTIVVAAERPASSHFAKLFGIDSVTVNARAKARAANPAEARWAAPIAVDERHPLLSGEGCPCWNEPTELDVEKVGPGAFRLINLDDSHGGTGNAILAEWIETGFDGFLSLAWYYSDPGYKPSSSHIKNALTDRIGEELLFPVYRQTREQGAGFEYEIIGWVGFHLSGHHIQGSHQGKLFGWFTRVIWEGIPSQSASQPDFGVRTISLVE